jgi:para-nitrobenzyl esterase
MRRLAFSLLLCGSLLACRAPEPSAPTRLAESARRVAQGELIGHAGLHGGHAWLGVPFAAPPVGPLRWRAPQPPPAWQGQRAALAFGPRCPQLASQLEGAERPGALIGDEDCLYLNVYAPAVAPAGVPQGPGRLPVMLWIHGGGNTIGSASFYDGSALASRHELVVVTVNYRLGPLGWLRHVALREGATPVEQSGNFGNLDHLAALEWVRDNIAAFGGDPDNVTIFGESAGGRDVLALLVSPLAAGLFQRAIVQSGGTNLATPEQAENFRDDESPGDAHSSNEVLARWVVELGVEPDRERAKARLAVQSPVRLAARMRAMPVADLFALYVDDPDEPGLGMLRHPRMFGDGVVLPAGDLHDRIATGEYHHVAIVLGSNRDENKLFMFVDPEHVWQLLGALPRLRDAQRYERVASLLSRSWKANSVDELAWRMRKVQGPSVFAYRWDWDEEPRVLGSDLSRMLGAAHALEIPFVFGHWNLGSEAEMLFDEDNRAGRVALSDAMMSYWAQFAYTGDPGRGRDGSLPNWNSWGPGPENEKYVIFDTEAGGGIRMASETISFAAIASELAAGAHGEGPERCALRDQLVSWWPRFELELARAANGDVRLACAGEAGAGAGGE